MTRDELRSLAAVRPERGRVVSIFLDLDPSQFATGDAKASAVNSALDDAERRISGDESLDRDTRAQLRADVTRIREALDPQHLAAGGAHGLAVFASGPAGLLEVVPTSQRLTPRVEVADRPVVEPLAPLAGDERLLVALAGQGQSRLFAGTGARLEEAGHLTDHINADIKGAVDEDRANHLRAVAAVLQQRVGDHDLLFTAGAEQAGSELAEHLHAYVRDKLAGHVRVDPGAATPATVQAAVAPLLEQRRAHREREAVERLAAGLGTDGGHAVAGREAVHDMLTQRRVETLLLAEGHSDEEAVEAALEQDADVLVLPADVPDLAEGVAALLRF